MSDTTSSELRQQWLEAGVRELRPLFIMQGQPLPDSLRVSVGWSTLGRRAVGACYHGSASSDQHREMFIAPVTMSSLKIMGTLAHECVHAALPDGLKHGKEFVHLGKKIGLVGKPTQLGEGGEAFAWFVNNFIAKYGEYPAGEIDAGAKKNKQKTAMLKCECGDCGYVCRTTAKWIESVGTPICPCNDTPMVCFG